MCVRQEEVDFQESSKWFYKRLKNFSVIILIEVLISSWYASTLPMIYWNK